MNFEKLSKTLACSISWLLKITHHPLFLGKIFLSYHFLAYTPRTNVISGDSDSASFGMQSVADLGGKFQLVSPKNPTRKSLFVFIFCLPHQPLTNQTKIEFTIFFENWYFIQKKFSQYKMVSNIYILFEILIWRPLNPPA